MRYAAALLALLLFTGCQAAHSGETPTPAPPAVPSSSGSEQPPLPEGIIETIFDSAYLHNGIEPLDIGEIADSAIVTVTWQDDQTLLFLTRSQPYFFTADAAQGASYPIKVYRYRLPEHRLTEVYEYTSNSRLTPPALVLNNRDVVLPTAQELIVLSGDDYSEKSRITLPSPVEGHEVSISPDGGKLAVPNDEASSMDILAVDKMTLIHRFQHPGGRVFRPVWSKNSNRVLAEYMYGEFSSSAYIYDLTDYAQYDSDYSQRMESYEGTLALIDGKTVVARSEPLYKASSVDLCIEQFDWLTGNLVHWTFPLEAAPYNESISGKGYFIGHILTDYFYTVVADPETQRVICTEKALRGPGEPPAWSRDGRKAAVLYRGIADRGDLQYYALMIDAAALLGNNP